MSTSDQYSHINFTPPLSEYPWKIERLVVYAVVCSECGVEAAYRTGNALLGPEYGCGFYCVLHIPIATTYPLAIYLLSPPGIAGADHPGTKIREDWPSGYDDHPSSPRNR